MALGTFSFAANGSQASPDAKPKGKGKGLAGKGKKTGAAGYRNRVHFQQMQTVNLAAGQFTKGAGKNIGKQIRRIKGWGKGKDGKGKGKAKGASKGEPIAPWRIKSQTLQRPIKMWGRTANGKGQGKAWLVVGAPQLGSRKPVKIWGRPLARGNAAWGRPAAKPISKGKGKSKAMVTPYASGKASGKVRRTIGKGKSHAMAKGKGRGKVFGKRSGKLGKTQRVGKDGARKMVLRTRRVQGVTAGAVPKLRAKGPYRRLDPNLAAVPKKRARADPEFAAVPKKRARAVVFSAKKWMGMWKTAQPSQLQESAAARAEEFFQHKSTPSAPAKAKTTVVSFAAELLAAAPDALQTCRSLLQFLDKKIEASSTEAPKVVLPEWTQAMPEIKDRVEAYADLESRLAGLKSSSWDARAKRVLNIGSLVQSNPDAQEAIAVHEKKLSDTKAALAKLLHTEDAPGAEVLQNAIADRAKWVDGVKREWLEWCRCILRKRDAMLAADGAVEKTPAKRTILDSVGILKNLLGGEGSLLPSAVA